MFKYKASDVIKRAIAVADMQNSNFITWGDSFHMLNAAYRKIYQDTINLGDLNYLQEVRLLAYGSAKYELPDDFYQLAMITDDYGNEIPMLGLASSRGDWGYQLRNGIIALQNVRSNVILKYYPTPDTITFKRERKTSNYINSSYGTPLTGFGSSVFTSNKYVIDFAGGMVNYSTLLASSSRFLLGKTAILDITAGNRLVLLGTNNYADTMIKPMLTTSGNFIENTFDNIDAAQVWGWSNDDGSDRYMTDGTDIYYNGTILGTVADLAKGNAMNGRVIYWNGKWALVTLSKIIYPDGSWETTDSPNAIALLKCDTETGYGYVVPTTGYQYTIEGWCPDTIIDYPNNILFDMTVYELAIQFRIKQSADPSGLQQVYQQLEKTYNKSITNNNDSFPTIRNVNKRFSRWSAF